MFTMSKRSYSEMRLRRGFKERFEYLRLGGEVGEITFGFDRWINQEFYRSPEWRRVRQFVIVRDMGLDLGLEDHEITGQPRIHHMNPMLPDQIIHSDPDILDPEFLICTSLDTHNAIHYGDASLLRTPFVERRPGDTKLW